jgi:hypothetical protein
VRVAALLLVLVLSTGAGAWFLVDRAGSEGGVDASRDIVTPSPGGPLLRGSPQAVGAKAKAPAVPDPWLPQGPEILGRLVDAEGKGLRGKVTCTALDGSTVVSGHHIDIGTEGWFSFSVPLDELDGRRCGLLVNSVGRVGRWISLPVLHAGSRIDLGAIPLSDRGLSIEGRIVHSSGEDSWTTVEAVPEAPVPPGVPGPRAAEDSVHLEEAGEFRIRGLVPGLYRLHVSLGGTTLTIEHVEAGRKELVIRLSPEMLPKPEPQFDVLVRVLGVPAETEPSFLRLSDLWAWGTRSPMFWGYMGGLDAERQGDAWRVRELGPDDAELLVRAAGFAPAVLPLSGPREEPYEVRLGAPSSLRGRIHMGGEPCKARVSLEYFVNALGQAEWPTDGSAPRLLPGHLRVSEESGAHLLEENVGNYSFGDLPPGQAWLTVHPVLDDSGPCFGACHEPAVSLRGRRVTLAGAQTLDLVVEPLATVLLDVSVPDVTATSPPLAFVVKVLRVDAGEVWYDDGRDARVVSAAGGRARFELSDLLPRERYDVLAQAAGDGGTWFGRLRSASIEPSRPLPALVLEKVPPLRGLVRDARGLPAPRSEVTAVSGSGDADGWLRFEHGPWVTHTDEAGRFTLVLPPVGQVTLTARSETGDRACLERTTASTAQDVALVLVSRAHVTGRIESSTGSPRLAGLRVRAFSEAGEMLTETIATADGWFQLFLPDVGPVRLVVEPLGTDRDECLVSRPMSGSAADVRLRLEPGITRTGLVVDADGRPVPQAKVKARGRWSDRGTRAGRDGRWRLPGLCDPEVEVTVTADDGRTASGRTRGEDPLRLVLPRP